LRKALGATAILAAIVLGSYAYGQRISRLNSWELDFTCRTPRVVEVVVEADRQVYTYVIYEVTNSSDSEIDFYPTFEIETEKGKPVRARSYPTVYAKIMKPLSIEALAQGKMTGIIKPGEKKTGIAIFKGVDPAADTLTVFVAGLTGDFKTQVSEDGTIKALYRTYKLIYKRPGDRFDASLDPITLEDSDWIWRG